MLRICVFTVNLFFRKECRLRQDRRLFCLHRHAEIYLSVLLHIMKADIHFQDIAPFFQYIINPHLRMFKCKKHPQYGAHGIRLHHIASDPFKDADRLFLINRLSPGASVIIKHLYPAGRCQQLFPSFFYEGRTSRFFVQFHADDSVIQAGFGCPDGRQGIFRIRPLSNHPVNGIAEGGNLSLKQNPLPALRGCIMIIGLAV